MRQTDLAYLAGVIDSDGFITIQRTTKANSGRCKGPSIYHCLKVGIAGTRTQPHDLAAALFGGNISSFTPRKHRIQFQWSITGPTAVRFIQAVGLYLRVKSDQAALGIKFQAMLDSHRAWQREKQKPPYRITESMRSARDAMHVHMCGLNMSRSKKAAGRLLDGREWSEFPQLAR